MLYRWAMWREESQYRISVDHAKIGRNARSDSTSIHTYIIKSEHFNSQLDFFLINLHVSRFSCSFLLTSQTRKSLEGSLVTGNSFMSLTHLRFQLPRLKREMKKRNLWREFVETQQRCRSFYARRGGFFPAFWK